MEYEDEIDRMRRRSRQQKTGQRQSHPHQGQQYQGQRQRHSDYSSARQRSHARTERNVGRNHERSRELNIIEFDDIERPLPSNVHPARRRSQSRDYDYETVFDYDDSSPRDRHRADRDVPNNQKIRKKKRQKRRFTFLKLLLLLAIAAGLYFGFQYFRGGSGFWTIAVFGVDSRNGSLEKGALSDVEMLCVIDRKTGEIKLVSVFRDTYLEISPDGTYHKINEAYFKGGHTQAVEALERNLDLKIDDYATFNWKAVADAITILGGIDLEISDSEFRYINAFITETVESTGLGSHHLEHAGMNHLDGVQAVAYARLRLMDTDYNRTARQRLVIQLAMNKAKEADFKTLSIVAQTVLPQLSTSISLDDVIAMAKNIKKYHIGETGGFPFSRGETNIGKKDCVIPLTLESNVIQLHQFLYGTENYQPSGTVKQISAKIAADSGMGEVAQNAPEARVAGQKALEGGGENPAPAAGGSPAPEGNQAGGNGAVGNGDDQGAAAEKETETTAVETSAEETQTEVSAEETSQDRSEAESTDRESVGASQNQGSDNGRETSANGASGENGSNGGPQMPGGSSGNSSGENSAGPGGQGNSGGQGGNVYDEKPVIETDGVGPGV